MGDHINNLLAAASDGHAAIALAASVTTDGMDISVQVKGAAGRQLLRMWMSEAATGIGVTADAYSGDLTAVTGVIHQTITSKKEWWVITDDSGLFEATLVASANPVDQYVAIVHGGALSVSGASGTHWEGV